jgi:hypothetical protein
MKTLISRLTMKPSKRAGFKDIVSGKYVRYWIDKFGDEYMATGKFYHRVKVE